MNAEIVAVGSEMLTPQKVDTNSLFLTEQLNTLGIEVIVKTIVGDDRARLADILRTAIVRSKILVVTGGLGPTEDDVTRDSVALAVGKQLHFNDSVLETIADRFRRNNRKMAEINRRQAYVIDGAEVLPNPNGTAPGQWVETPDGVIIILLPGPPRELKGMWQSECFPRLQQKLPPMVIRTSFLRVAGMPESDVDQLIAPVYTRCENPACTILAAAGDIQVHLRARGTTAEEADALLEEVSSQIIPLLGDRLYTTEGLPLEAVIGVLLSATNKKLAVAESCTGGMLAERITQVPGSSAYFHGGFLTYTEDAKSRLLDVALELIERAGVVSAAVAEAMATGARQKLGVDYALSVTGFAGPDGGTETEPVGAVYIALASPTEVISRRFHFLRDRTWVRTMATNAALDMLRIYLLKQEQGNLRTIGM